MLKIGLSLITGWLLLINCRNIKNKYIVWRWKKILSLNKHKSHFENIYNDVNGFNLSKQARKTYDAPEYVYGEIEFIAFIALLSQAKPNQNSIFYDLGSGSGKAVLAANMVFNIKKSIGIEIFANLHNAALKQRDKLQKINNYNNQANNIYFINDNFLNQNFSDANIIFINAAAFFGETWQQLNTKLDTFTHAVTVLSVSKKLLTTSYVLKKTTSITMSWGIVTAYIYENIVFL